MNSVNENLTSKEYFEVLAFCALVKLCVRSSVIHNATLRRLKVMTHLGTDRLRRILRRGKANGMIIISADGAMTVKALYDHKNTDNQYVYKLKNYYRSRNKKQDKENIRFNLTLTKVMDMLRKAVVAHHVKKVENIRQHSLLTQNPKNLTEYRKGKRFVRRLAVWGYDFFISNSRLAQVARCSVSKLKKMKGELISKGEIGCEESNALVFEDARQFNLSAYRKYCMGTGYVFVGTDGKVYKHNPNVYSYKGKKLAFVPKNIL